MRWLIASFDRAWSFIALIPYNTRANRYVSQTSARVHGPMKIWLDKAVDGLNRDATIFEIGSGSGRDADYLEEAGFRVTRSDAAEPFIEHLRSKGHECVRFDALGDSVPPQADLVVANAVFCHFTIDQTARVLQRYRKVLEPGSRVAFTVKSDKRRQRVPMNTRLGLPRYFSYWRRENVMKVLHDCGFAPVAVTETGGGTKTDRWLNVVAVVPGSRKTGHARQATRKINAQPER